MIAVVDYGIGNLFSISRSLKYLGHDCIVTSRPQELVDADRIILPGVGAFGDAMAQLEKTGLIPLLEKLKDEKPFLGICLGMQLLFEESEEYGTHKGLGFLKGRVVPLGGTLKVPHMGWNALHITADTPLLADVREGDHVYFVHSFHAVGCEDSLCAVTDYGQPVTAVVASGNVCGCQFHPEKSGAVGLAILGAFARM